MCLVLLKIVFTPVNDSFMDYVFLCYVVVVPPNGSVWFCSLNFLHFDLLLILFVTCFSTDFYSFTYYHHYLFICPLIFQLTAFSLLLFALLSLLFLTSTSILLWFFFTFSCLAFLHCLRSVCSTEYFFLSNMNFMYLAARESGCDCIRDSSFKFILPSLLHVLFLIYICLVEVILGSVFHLMHLADTLTQFLPQNQLLSEPWMLLLAWFEVSCLSALASVP